MEKKLYILFRMEFKRISLGKLTNTLGAYLSFLVPLVKGEEPAKY